MTYTVSCNSTGTTPPDELEDGAVTIDLDEGTARLALSGRLGPRAASALRASLEAMDGLPGAIEVDGHEIASASPGVALVLIEAETRRRSLGCSDIRIVASTPQFDALLPGCDRCGLAVLTPSGHACAL